MAIDLNPPPGNRDGRAPRETLVAALQVMLGAVLLILAGCQERAAPSPAPAVTTSVEAPTPVEARLAALDAKIAGLEKQLSTKPGSAGGKGGLAQGSSLRIGGGDETVLERLRRFEQERNAAQAQNQALAARAAALTGELAEARGEGRTLAERADYLARTEESLVAAQQTLSERSAERDAIQARLATSELQRLRGEREYSLLAAAVLKLSPERLGSLPEIQDRIRTQVAETSDGP